MVFVPTTLWTPSDWALGAQAAPAMTGPAAITTNGDKFAMVGRVWLPGRGSKNIQKVGFRWGSVTKAGGSGWTLSLQDVDLATGVPFRPDGTQDQTVAMSAASITSGAWYQTGNLSTTRTVSHGDRLAIVIEWDVTGKQGADSFIVNYLTVAAARNAAEGGFLTSLSGTWAAIASGMPMCVLEMDDGSFGSLEYSLPNSTTIVSDLVNNTAGQETIGLQFQLPFNCKVDGCWAHVFSSGNTADFNLVLSSISGSALTTLATHSVDANALRAAASQYTYQGLFAEQTLTKNTDYFLGVVPTTANNITVYSFTVNSSGYLAGAPPGGNTWFYNTADGATLSSPTTTRRPFMGLRISAVDDGTGSSAPPVGRSIIRDRGTPY